MTDTFDDLTQSLLQRAKEAGADAADVLAVRGNSISIDVRNGVLEQAERSEATDIGLRVFVGQRVANVSSSDVRADSLAIMAERAVAMAREAPEDPYVGLADPSQLAQNRASDWLELYDPTPEPSPAELAQDALVVAPGLRHLDPQPQVHLASEEPLNLLTRRLADPLEHGPLPPDDDRFLARSVALASRARQENQ